MYIMTWYKIPSRHLCWGGARYGTLCHIYNVHPLFTSQVYYDESHVIRGELTDISNDKITIKLKLKLFYWNIEQIEKNSLVYTNIKTQDETISICCHLAKNIRCLFTVRQHTYRLDTT